MIRTLVACFLGGALLASAAHAAPIHVEVTGTVEYNVIGGDMSVVQPGDPVVTSFDVDTTNFVDSPNFPTRGYEIDLSSWSMTVGGVNVPIINPQPFGPAYFVLRNNDPAVDGFLISRNVEFPQPISVGIPGLTQTHEFNFLRTFNDGTPLPSLDIEDAIGSYDQTNLSVYSYWIGRFGNPGAEYVYQTITITPEPGTLALLGLALIPVIRRRK